MARQDSERTQGGFFYVALQQGEELENINGHIQRCACKGGHICKEGPFSTRDQKIGFLNCLLLGEVTAVPLRIFFGSKQDGGIHSWKGVWFLE